MPGQSCAPPASLTLWGAALLAGTGLLVVMALALAPLEPGRWRWRTLGALLALALAGWSLALLSRVQAAFDALASQNQSDPYYCLWGGMHGPPRYQFWLKQTAQVIDPLQRQALITASATIALAVVIVAVGALSWRRGRADRAGARRGWRPGPGRALALGLLLALNVASLADFTLIQVRSAMTQVRPCATPMSATEVQQVEGMGIALIPSRDAVPVSAQAALATSEQSLGASLPMHPACTVTQLYFVDASSVAEVPRFSLVWVVGYRIPGAVAGPGVLATPPSEEWTFVDAQSGVYLYGAWLSTVGGA